MKIGVPKEIKNNENRVAMTPAGVWTLLSAGHEVVIETGAGLGSSFTDTDYKEAGAIIVATAEQAWDAEMVMKVKEPIASEYGFFKERLPLIEKQQKRTYRYGLTLMGPVKVKLTVDVVS